MKQCPQCSKEYDDSVNFCATDGRALVAKVVTRSRLCPNCANSVAEGASKCPYCKADLTLAPAEQWPVGGSGAETDTGGPTHRSLRTAKGLLIAGVILCVIGILLIGRSMLGREGSESQRLLEEKIKELQARDEKIRMLEGQLTQVKEELAAGSNQLAQLKDKLDESRRDLSSTRQKPAVGSPRLTDRQASSRTEPISRSEPRPADPVPSPSSRRPAEPGVYETIRATTVYEEPSNGSRVVSQISQGTTVTVVRSVGEWLEVRSKHGKPPGFIRRDDAMFRSGAN